MLKRARDLNTKEKRQFIHSNLKRLGAVTRGCQVVGISRSNYYYKPKGKKHSDMDLAERIEEIALNFPSYGYRRITAQLWRADITYRRIATSFVYLAALIDGFSRKAIGYALGRTLSVDLSASALNEAISKRDTGDLIHHSDRGIQYCSYDYVMILKDHEISISMSGKANPYDNAKIESFFRTLRVEEVYMFEYETYGEVLKRIPYFIEEVYNKKRLHSSLGYMPPEKFENKNNEKMKGNESRQLILIS